jgi:hypothetical protein
MTTYRAMWEDVPQLDVSGEDLLEVLRRTENDYEAFAFDPADDPDYLTPELRWALGWNTDGKRRRLVLFKDGTVTGVRIDEVPAAADTDLSWGAYTPAQREAALARLAEDVHS